MRQFHLWILCLTAMVIAMGSYASGWEFVERDGVSFVPLSNVRSFYGFTSEKKVGGSRIYEMAKVQMKIKPASQELMMNGIKFILSHPIKEDSTKGLLISRTDIIKIIDPVIRPRHIQNKRAIDTVIIDPGHGGHDSGATNLASREKDLNLTVGKKLKSLLQRDGYKVVMTRESDTYLTLQERVAVANRYRNAVFISIHFNSGGASAHGIEVFTLVPAGTSSDMSRYVRKDPMRGNTQDSANIALATSIQGNLLRSPQASSAGMNPFDRGIKRARFSVLCTIQHPAVLVECGFLSHAKEAMLAKSDSYQNYLAQSLAAAVKQYRRAVVGR
ncbi:MAG: N-acetylmuramoyl-L-alanine amidase [Akkermansia sp.]